MQFLPVLYRIRFSFRPARESHRIFRQKLQTVSFVSRFKCSSKSFFKPKGKHRVYFLRLIRRNHAVRSCRKEKFESSLNSNSLNNFGNRSPTELSPFPKLIFTFFLDETIYKPIDDLVDIKSGSDSNPLITEPTRLFGSAQNRIPPGLKTLFISHKASKGFSDVD